MQIPSHQLVAFFKTAQTRHFTRAAEALGITQSALSQRITNLESELEVTLFIRDPSGPILTEVGERLLRYCQMNDSLEREVLSQLKSTQAELAGVVRVAAFSSVLRSIVMPTLAPFLRRYPAVRCEFRSYDVAELFSILKNAEAEVIVTDHELVHKGIMSHVLGEEEYVVIESARYATPPDLYLDHDPSDSATASFFGHQKSAVKKYRRNYMGDVYGILSGVELGLGRAVMSKHLIKNNRHVKRVRGYPKFSRPIILHYFEQPYYSKLHGEMIAHLIKSASGYLG